MHRVTHERGCGVTWTVAAKARRASSSQLLMYGPKKRVWRHLHRGGQGAASVFVVAELVLVQDARQPVLQPAHKLPPHPSPSRSARNRPAQPVRQTSAASPEQGREAGSKRPTARLRTAETARRPVPMHGPEKHPDPICMMHGPEKLREAVAAATPATPRHAVPAPHPS